MDKLLTIILPVYNSQLTVKKCIESILDQTYKFIELIIIDDGSSDNTLKICKDFEKNNSNIKVFHQNNLGVSYARNKGLQHASGNYIQFVDSDDWINKNSCEKMLNCFFENEDVDQVVCGLNIYKNEKKLRNPHLEDKILNIKEVFEDFLYVQKIFASPCNKIYKKELITSFFDTNFVMGEDLKFNIEYYKKVNKVCSIKDCLYNVSLDNDISLNRKFNENRFENYLKNQEEIYNFCSEKYPGFNKSFIYNNVAIGLHAAFRDFLVNKMNNKKIKYKINKYYSEKLVKDSKNQITLSRIDYRIFYKIFFVKNPLLIKAYFNSKFLIRILFGKGIKE